MIQNKAPLWVFIPVGILTLELLSSWDSHTHISKCHLQTGDMRLVCGTMLAQTQTHTHTHKLNVWYSMSSLIQMAIKWRNWIYAWKTRKEVKRLRCIPSVQLIYCSLNLSLMHHFISSLSFLADAKWIGSHKKVMQFFKPACRKTSGFPLCFPRVFMSNQSSSEVKFIVSLAN